MVSKFLGVGVSRVLPQEVLGQLMSHTQIMSFTLCIWCTSLNHVGFSGGFSGVQQVLINTVGGTVGSLVVFILLRASAFRCLRVRIRI